MNAGNFCTREVVTAKDSFSVLEAARLMRRHHVGCLIVTADDNGSRPVGILTDRDIVIEVLAEEVPLDSVAVKDIMSYSPVIAREDDDILTALRLMEERGVRRIPVTNSRDELTGILSTDDIIKVLHQGLGNILSICNREFAQERQKTR